MTARHNLDPRPSKRSQRRDRQARRVLFDLIVGAVESSPEMRGALKRQADVLTSPGMRALLQRLEWARPQPLRTGMVTWPTRRRRRRP